MRHWALWHCVIWWLMQPYHKCQSVLNMGGIRIASKAITGMIGTVPTVLHRGSKWTEKFKALWKWKYFTSVNFSNPIKCPWARSMEFFWAYLLFPSIIKATCLGIGPLFTIHSHREWYHAFLVSFSSVLIHVDEESAVREVVLISSLVIDFQELVWSPEDILNPTSRSWRTGAHWYQCPA